MENTAQKTLYISENEAIDIELNKNNCRYKPMTANEVPYIFPECKPILNNQIKELKIRLNKAMDRKRKVEERINGMKIPYKDKEVYNMVYVGWVEMQIEELIEKINKYKKVIKAIDFKKKFMEMRENGLESHITDEHIITAKQKPISDYIEFNRQGFACCIWHEEQTGSLKYYPDTNKCHCFGGCGKSFDVIDVVQKLNGLSFLDGVKFILNI